jgi:glycine/D-amino acid oxidase-like deaminating enzyme
VSSGPFRPGPDRPLPRGTAVAIIGGGIVGVSAALCLARAGVPVLLCEKGRIGAEQSARNWGWIRKQGRDLAELPLAIGAQAIWQELAPRLGPEAGLRQGGIVYAATDEATLARHAAWLASAQGFGLDTRLLSPAETDTLLGQDGRRFRGALHTPSDRQAEPDAARAALARIAAAAGAILAEETAVRGLDLAGGRVAGIVTEHGPVACTAAILAGGAWSRTFLEGLGLAFPQLAVLASVLRTAPIRAASPGPVSTPLVAVRPRRDGGVTLARREAQRFDLIPAAFVHFRAFLPMLRASWRGTKLRAGASFFGPLGRYRPALDRPGPFEAARVLDPAPDRAALAAALRDAPRVFPELAGLRPVAEWGGLIDTTPDELPAIGPVRGVPGLVLASGFSGHGFGIGPAAGRLAAAIATGAAAAPPALSPARFGL